MYIYFNDMKQLCNNTPSANIATDLSVVRDRMGVDAARCLVVEDSL